MAQSAAKTPGKPAPRSELVNVPRLVSSFFTTGSKAYVSKDGHTTFATIYPAGSPDFNGVKYSYVANPGDDTLAAELDSVLGTAWDEELEPYRYSGDGTPVRWLSAAIANVAKTVTLRPTRNGRLSLRTFSSEYSTAK